MAVIGIIKELLEAGVHFGHPKNRWNPKMKPYIYGVRNGIYIIDLEKTAQLILKACEFVRDVASKGGCILFVGTKKQVQDMIEEEAKRCNMFFINNRWLGGTLTNFETVRKSIARLKEIEKLKEDGKYDLITKKEQSTLDKEMGKLMKNLGGIVGMDKLPDAVYVIDPNREDIAVKEAKKLGIPILGIVDTNCDPDPIEYLISGNDDAIKSTKLITSYVANAIIEGRRFYSDGKISAAKKEKEEVDKVLNVDEEELLDIETKVVKKVDETELKKIKKKEKES
ncbi:MAG: 30S ribosomal protein S2 [Candidatus Saelkia tenebricola]|nr:30S ribosomal protein S2 [Candidatus Saelkia tenebricola]